MDLVRALVARSFRENRLEPTGPDFRFALSTASLGSLELSVVDLQNCTIPPEANEQFFVEHVTAQGVLPMTLGGAIRPCSNASGVVVSPSKPFGLSAGTSCVLLGVRAETDRLERHFQLMTDQRAGPIEFTDTVDLTRRSGAQRGRLVRELFDNAARQPGPDGSPFASALEDAYLTALLSGQPHSQQHLLARRAPDVDLAAVRRVEDFIRAHPEQPLHSEMLVALSGVSTTALYEAFKRLHDTTPMRMLRDVRLDRVRDELLAPAPATSVTSAALDCGIVHLPRFSASYAERFGELPSQTLREARRLAS